jgi:hypothetical protein
MRKQDARGRVAQPARVLWHSVFQALENERCLDLRYRAISTSLRDDERVPNYKVMKQLALRKRLGPLYRPFIAIALVLIPVLAVVEWLFAILASATRASRPGTAIFHIVATTPTNIGLIEAALANDPSLQGLLVDRDILALRRLSAELGLRDVVFCIVSHALLLGHILQLEASKRTDLLLHSRDALVLLMLACYAQQHPEHGFATDDHYQRWAYLLSHHSPNLSIVQHGFLDQHIRFANPFGVARVIYVRDPLFVPEFASYYRILESRHFSPLRELASNPFSHTGVFIASSFPSIAAEIELVRLIKAGCDVPVIVKFHPAHQYDQQKQTLAALAEYVCTDEVYPSCKIFVSHNSFMEFDYRVCGVPTFSIFRSGGPKKTAQAILNLLNLQRPQDHPSCPHSHNSISSPQLI